MKKKDTLIFTLMRKINRMKHLISLLLIGAILAPIFVLAKGNTSLENFQLSKKLIMEVYEDHRNTFYCNVEFDSHGNIVSPPQELVGNRAKRVEIDHVVPAEAFGHTFIEWSEGNEVCRHKGRKCAEMLNREYRLMQGDLYNLVPSIGTINALKSNLKFGLLPLETPNYEFCSIKIRRNRVEVSSELRGFVARVHLYMAKEYPEHFQMTKQQRVFMEEENKRNPVSPWECTRTKRISEIQGNENTFVKIPCTEAGLY